ncbi:uncharacterized protein LOC125207341 isoform X2 [Salvia hispanica]|uniref:uncharacterized protein LOC125207341 isoform X2 n=1 Tax=Salvia hispanica TaxID=49212 RepID=UPI002008F899|nr:uncharacterized protein LOC125207341 isoform X2 [Salvia hispanica]
MKGFEKGISPSNSNSNSNRNLPSSGSVENNENDSNWGKLNPEIASNKTGYGKHFMSGVPRKKVLAEIKGIPKASVAQAHENSNLGSEKSPPKKGVFDQSVKVYDPLTNYLSPRPRFLRFNPNRRREIFERLEKELNTSLDSEEASGDEEVVDSSLSPPKGSGDGDGDGNGIDCCEVKEEGIGEIVASSRSPVKESDVDRRNGGASDEDNGSVVDGYGGEEEEEMEERRGCVRGVLKLLFTLIACLLLASYMFPMNSPTDSTTLSGVVIKNETVVFVSMDLSGNGFFEVGDGNGSSVEEAGVEVGSYCEPDESTEAQIVEYLEWNENVDGEDNSIEGVEVKEANYGENDESVEAEIAEYSEWDEKEMFENENVDGEDAQFEGVRDARFEFRVDESEHLLDVKNDENVDGGFLLNMEVVSSYAGLDEDSLYKDEVAETVNLVNLETVESEDDSSNPLEPMFEETPVESKDTDETGSVQEELSGSMDEADDIGDDEDAEVGMEKSLRNTVIAGVSALLVVVSTSLAIVYHSRQQSKRGTSSKEAPKQKLAVEGNANPVLLPSVDRKVEFLPRASLPSHSMREAPRELSRHIHAPTVELIGEIVVGQARNSENSRDNAATMSWTRGSRPQVAPAPSQPSSLELHPSASSTSSGSFTTESKTSKKERGQIKEAMVVPTPVRRSSRLRNRPAVTSP